MFYTLSARCIIYAARLSVCVFIGEQSLAHLSSFISHLWRQVMVCTQQRKKVVVSLSLSLALYIYCCWLVGGEQRRKEHSFSYSRSSRALNLAPIKSPRSHLNGKVCFSHSQMMTWMDVKGK